MKHDVLKLTAPTSWNELTQKQLFYVMKRFIRELPEKYVLINFLEYFCRIKLLKGTVRHKGKNCFTFRKRFRKFLMTAEQVTIMLTKLEFLLKETGLTKNPLPVFKIKRTKYYGPADSLYNITLREFIFAEMNFMSFCKGRHVVYLNNLIAILWRPQVKPYEPDSPHYSGDRRERFNDHIFIKRAHRLYKLPLYKKYALFSFYSGARIQLQKEFPAVFKEDGGSSNPRNMSKQMISLVKAVNGGDPTKDEALLDINVRSILEEMQTASERVDKIKSK